MANEEFLKRNKDLEEENLALKQRIVTIQKEVIDQNEDLQELAQQLFSLKEVSVRM